MATQKVIFGEEGSVKMKPDAFSLTYDSANVAANVITTDEAHPYITGDEVTVTDGESGTIDTALTSGQNYFVIVLTSTTISLATSEANALATTAIILNGDGSGVNNTIVLANFDAVATVTQWTMTINKATAEKTTLGDQARSFAGGMLDYSGSMTAQYEAEDTLAARKAKRVFNSVNTPYDNGNGEVELYVSDATVSDADRKITGKILVTSATVGNTLGNIVEFSMNFQGNGLMTFSGLI